MTSRSAREIHDDLYLVTFTYVRGGPRPRISTPSVSEKMAARRENVKRKRRGGNACANPLFVKWVEELIQDAEERNLNSKFTYKKVNKMCFYF